MARLWSCGFELQSVTAGIEVDSTAGTAPTINTTTPNGGSACLSCHVLSGTSYVVKQFATTSATNNVYVRFYVNFNGFPTSGNITVMVIRSAAAGNNLTIRVNSTGTIFLNNEQTSTQVGSTSSTLSTSTWYCIEVSYVYSTGVAAAYVNGTQFTSGTANTSVATDTIELGIIDTSAANRTWLFDDVAVNDQTGSYQTDLPGFGYLVRATPNGAGDSNTWLTGTGGTAGSSNNYTRVNEVTPNSASSYNLYRSPTATPSDLYTVSVATIPTGATINAVMVGAWFAGASSSANSSFEVQLEKASGGTISRSSSITPTSTTWMANATAVPHAYPLILYNDPDGTAWTPSTVASMQIGVYGNSTSTNYAEISTVWAYVDYTPSSGVNASVTQVAATLTFTGGTQSIATVQDSAVAQSAATLTFTGGTQVSQTLASVTQSAATLTFNGGTQSAASVQDVSISQAGATLTFTGGTQSIATVQDSAVSQSGATLTLTGGTQSIAAQISTSATQSAATLTFTGSTQSITSVQDVSIAQSAATLTLTGGTQSVATVNIVSVSQSAATLTLTGGTQSIATVNDVALTQSHATLTFSGGTQAIAAIQVASVSQSAATITFSGGTQAVAAGSIISSSVTQVGATLTLTGGTQTLATVQDVSISQTYATLTFTGGTQSAANVNIVAVSQSAATLTFTGSTQVVSGGSGTVTTHNFVWLIDGTPALITRSNSTKYVQLLDGRYALKAAKNLYVPLSG